MVKSPAMDVRVLGTSFNIKCRPDNSFAETTLIEGEVEVKINRTKEELLCCRDKSCFKQGNRADASKTGRSQDGDSLA